MQLNSDHLGDPGDDHTIHSPPGGGSEERRDSEDMVIKGVELQREDKVAPTGLGGGSWAKEDEDQRANVLNTHRLGVEANDDGGLVRRSGSTTGYSRGD